MIASVAAAAAKVISRAPTEAAVTLPSPVLAVAVDVLEHHDRVVDHDARPRASGRARCRC